MSQEAYQKPIDKEVLLKLIELQMSQFNKTRDVKTRINISIWTFFVISSGLVMNSDVSIPLVDRLIFWLVVASYSCLIVLHFYWMKGIQASLDYDKSLWKNYRLILGYDPEPTPKRKVRLSKWVIIETGVTLILALLSILSLSLAT